MKWYALGLIIVGFALYAPAKPPGEFGLPLYAQFGMAFLAAGLLWMGILIFISV